MMKDALQAALAMTVVFVVGVLVVGLLFSAVAWIAVHVPWWITSVLVLFLLFFLFFLAATVFEG